jgi:diacylglycerol kinase (ATP)
MPGIGVINNPYSRKNKKNPDWMRSLGYLAGTKGEAVATKHIEDIHDMVKMFKERSIDILAINGGDGSNSLVLTAMIDEYGDQKLPMIALLRGGTMNIAANSCGIKGTSAGLMVNLVHKYRQAVPFETTWRDTLKIEGRYGFVFGNGFIQSFLEVLYAGGKKTPWTTAKLLGKGAASTVIGGRLARQLFERVHARVTVDGRRLAQESFAALAAATVEQMGLNFKPFHRCQEESNSFHLLGIVSSPAGIAARLPKIYLGKKITEKVMIEMVAKEVLIESDKPLKYTLDGENYTSGLQLKIGTGPRLQIIIR